MNKHTLQYEEIREKYEILYREMKTGGITEGKRYILKSFLRTRKTPTRARTYRIVLSRFKGTTYREIGRKCGVSPSRASQIFDQFFRLLCGNLLDYRAIDWACDFYGKEMVYSKREFNELIRLAAKGRVDELEAKIKTLTENESAAKDISKVDNVPWAKIFHERVGAEINLERERTIGIVREELAGDLSKMRTMMKKIVGTPHDVP